MDNIIHIEAERFSIDWTYTDKHDINLDEIWWFELDWRWDSWHIVVVTKQELSSWVYYKYDLSHWVDVREVVKLLMDKRAKIKCIRNYHNSDNFVEQIIYLTSALWKN